ncbi:cystathionine gamma-synthase family protein [Glaciecola sp. XM2]|uniref:cystathionine gamma-synthase family protein n=1 Tax=Glaciecola sp. XM2 TaxID=1914931 RepID=UPI001BDE83F9|nr:cystathionine gamma-synthase family protein [Glaciecola sp. XM2]
MKKSTSNTQLVHADRLLNRPQHGAVHEATNNSVLFEFEDVAQLESVFQGKEAGHVYSRSSSGSAVALQNMLCALEDGVGAVAFATGMAGISGVLFSLLKAGDHIIVSQFLFGNTRSFMETLQQFGIQISFVDVSYAQCVQDAINENTTLVFCESIANPGTQVSDIEGIVKLCTEHDLLFILDNTMTPATMLNAKALNVSMIVTSLTKYIGGHGNVLGGAAVDLGNYNWENFSNISDKYKVADTSQWGLTQIRKRGLRDMGATLAPASAHQISVGLETLNLRLDKTCINAMAIAKFLDTHASVAKVFYPGMPEHPQHARAKALFNGQFGGILSFELNNNIDMRKFLNALQLVICATHLGDTRTLALPVATTIFYENGPEQREVMGIGDSMIRMSIGIEDAQDVIDDIAQALAVCSER